MRYRCMFTKFFDVQAIMLLKLDDSVLFKKNKNKYKIYHINALKLV